MARKLFALEDADVIEAVGEMEVAPEVGEVADVVVDTQEAASETDAQAEAIVEGVEASDQLEQVEELVEEASEGEGLDPVAAEAVKIAVESICARIGANPKSMYSLYATENFRSASSRRANTKIALEGIGEFLKDLWAKIKAALTSLWNKVKEFFGKHVSDLGRAKKAIESMKRRISNSSGKMEKAYIEDAPSSLVNAFVGDVDISSAVVSEFIKRHTVADGTVDKIQEKAKTATTTAKGKLTNEKPETLKDFAESIFSADDVSEIGTEAEPLIGGVYIKYTISPNKNDGEVDIEVETNTVTGEKDLGLSIADKSAINGLLNEVKTLIDTNIKKKDKFEKSVTEFNKTMLDVEKSINALAGNASADKEHVKAARRVLKIIYKLNSQTPKIVTTKAALDIKLAKAVIGYAGTCLKYYK